MNKLTELKEYIQENRQEGLNHFKNHFDLTRLGEEEIFYQLVFCLLVPAGNAYKTDQAVRLLREKDYFNKSLDDISLYEYIRPYVRFPRQKAVRLHSFKRSAPSLMRYLIKSAKTSLNSQELRDGLVNRIRGMGYKAASHFLRNIGIKDLAIVDTHVLKYKPFFMPKEIVHYEPSSAKRYLEIEKHFNRWAQEEFDMEPAFLDWFLWCKESGNPVTALEY